VESGARRRGRVAALMAGWWWYSGVCELGLSAALLWAYREGEVELDATQWREAQPGQGRGKGTALPVHRGSAVGNRRPRGACELARVGYVARQIADSKPGRCLVGACWGRALVWLAGAGIVG
jgi:hypothetical protein